jgi:hypothetical protein
MLGARSPLREGKRAEITLERRQQVRDLRSKSAGLLDCSRRLGLSLNTVKRYDRAEKPVRLQRAPQYRPTLVDPYRDHLRKRRAENPGIPVRQLLREIRELGYQGSSNLLVRYVNQGRADSDRPHLAPRETAQLLLTRPESMTDGQRETATRISSACPEMNALQVQVVVAWDGLPRKQDAVTVGVAADKTTSGAGRYLPGHARTSTSRRPSPTALMLHAPIVMARPGTIVAAGSPVKLRYALAMSAPHEGAGGGTPSPRKLSAASTMRK